MSRNRMYICECLHQSQFQGSEGYRLQLCAEVGQSPVILDVQGVNVPGRCAAPLPNAGGDAVIYCLL